jgi:WD40 repeat protein/Big-like domain-containing protein
MKTPFAAGALLSAIAASVSGCRSESTALRPTDCTAAVVAISPGVPEVAVRDSLSLTAAIIKPNDLCNPSLPVSALRWTSSDSTVARIDPARGVVTGIRRGVVTITVHAPDSARVLGEATLHAYTPLFGRIVYTRIIQSSYPPYPCPSGTGTCPPSMWTMAPDGSDQQLLLDSLNYPESPRVSPDGHTVVFEDWGLLYTVDAAGLAKHQITTTLANNFVPAWSPDGRWVLFTGYRSGGDTSHVYVVHPDGTGQRQLTFGPSSTYGAVWSPDGSQILVMQEINDTSGALVQWEAAVMDSGGRNPRVVKTFCCGYTAGFPAWSPDGGSLLFLDGGSSHWSIGRLRLSDSSYAVLADAQGNRPGEWSPDGQSIVYGAGDLWVMNADGSGQHDVLSNAFVNMEASWGPATPAASVAARTRLRSRH